MREPIAPTLDELLAECRRISAPHPGGKTTREWGKVWKMSEIAVRDVIRYGLTNGKMVTEVAHRPDVMRPGKRVLVYLHRFVEGKANGKRTPRSRSTR